MKSMKSLVTYSQENGTKEFGMISVEDYNQLFDFFASILKKHGSYTENSDEWKDFSDYRCVDPHPLIQTVTDDDLDPNIAIGAGLEAVRSSHRPLAASFDMHPDYRLPLVVAPNIVYGTFEPERINANKGIDVTPDISDWVSAGTPVGPILLSPLCNSHPDPIQGEKYFRDTLFQSRFFAGLWMICVELGERLRLAVGYSLRSTKGMKSPIALLTAAFISFALLDAGMRQQSDTLEDLQVVAHHFTGTKKGLVLEVQENKKRIFIYSKLDEKVEVRFVSTDTFEVRYSEDSGILSRVEVSRKDKPSYKYIIKMVGHDYEFVDIPLLREIPNVKEGIDRIVGAWDNSEWDRIHSNHGTTEIWRFTKTGSILREYRARESTRWSSISGSWEKKTEDEREYYHLTWFNKFESAAEFYTYDEYDAEFLVIVHGDQSIDLRPRVEDKTVVPTSFAPHSVDTP